MSNNAINQFILLSKKYFKIYLGISISVFLFILFFQPFPTINFEFENKLLFIAGFGIIMFIVQVVIQIIFQPHLIRNREEGDDNSLLNSVYYISQVVLAGVAYTFYIRYVGHTIITFNIVVRAVVICLSLPVTIHLQNTLSWLQTNYKSQLQENKNLQDKLNQFSESYTNRFIELNSENESDNFSILVADIVFFKSADNYVEVGFREGDEIKKKMIRNTLKNIENQLREFNNFIRTHRSSIVNIQYVRKLHKNFNTYWLTLDETRETVPVSRQYLLVVKNLF